MLETNACVKKSPQGSLLLVGLGGGGLGDLDGDSLALGEELMTIGLVGVGELADAGGLGTIVGNKGSNTLDLTAVLSVDLDVDTVGVQLTVSDGVVPEPHEDGVSRGSRGGDLDIDGVLGGGDGSLQAVADDGLDDNPGLALVVRESVLAVSTTVGGTDRVLGLDGLAGLEGLTLRGRDGVLADGSADGVVGADGRVEVIVEGLALGRGGAAGEGAVAGAGGAETDVGFGHGGVGEDGEAGSGGHGDEGRLKHF